MSSQCLLSDLCVSCGECFFVGNSTTETQSSPRSHRELEIIPTDSEGVATGLRFGVPLNHRQSKEKGDCRSPPFLYRFGFRRKAAEVYSRSETRDSKTVKQ